MIFIRQNVKEEYSYSSSKSSTKNERIDPNKDENERYHRRRTNSSQSDIQSKLKRFDRYWFERDSSLDRTLIQKFMSEMSQQII